MIYRCILKENGPKSNLDNADIVLFHAPTREQPVPIKSNKPNPSNNSNNKISPLYVLVSLEQPKYAPILSDFHSLKQFDLLVTYSLQSIYPNTNIINIPVTYFPLHILSPQSVLQPARPFATKTGYETGTYM